MANTIKNEGLLDAGYDHILLDDCWGLRDPDTKKIVADSARFPEGMPSFIEKIHDLGFKFGLYTDIGTSGCHNPYAGSFPYYDSDAATFKEWKVDYVKFDGCDLPDGYTAEELTCNMSNSLLSNEADVWFNFHCWHTGTCASCGTSFRVYHDHHDEWSSTAAVIQFLAEQRQPFWGANPGKGWPDPDFVFTGGQGCNGTDPGPDAGAGSGPSPPGQRCPGQSEVEYVTEFTIWAVGGGQIVFASDPRDMTDFQRKVLLNDELISVFRDVEHFGAIEIDIDKETNVQVWTRPLSDGTTAAALYNPNNNTADVSIHFSGTKHVRDLWTHTSNGTATNVFVARSVPAHGTVAVRLCDTVCVSRTHG